MAHLEQPAAAGRMKPLLSGPFLVIQDGFGGKRFSGFFRFIRKCKPEMNFIVRQTVQFMPLQTAGPFQGCPSQMLIRKGFFGSSIGNPVRSVNVNRGGQIGRKAFPNEQGPHGGFPEIADLRESRVL